MKPYVFESNNWSQQRYDDDILFNSNGVHQPTGRHKTNSARDQFEEIKPCLTQTRNGIDIGARWGSFTVQMHKFGFEHVYMAELRDIHFKGISYNVDLSRATVYNYPIMNRSGTVSAAQKTITNKDFGELSCYSIDDMNVGNVDFIKIDVDGPDRLVLEGAVKTIEKYKPVIYIEHGEGQIAWEKKHYRHATTKDFWKKIVGDSYTSHTCTVEDDNMILVPK